MSDCELHAPRGRRHHQDHRCARCRRAAAGDRRGLPPIPGSSMLEKRRYRAGAPRHPAPQAHVGAARSRRHVRSDPHGAGERRQRLRRAVPPQRGVQHDVRPRHHRARQGPRGDRDGPGGRGPVDHPHRHPCGARCGARGPEDGGVRRVIFENVPVVRLPSGASRSSWTVSVRPSATSPSAAPTTPTATRPTSECRWQPSQHDRLIEVGRLVKRAVLAADVHRRPGGARPRIPLRRHLHRAACGTGPPQQARVHLRRGGGRPLARRGRASARGRLSFTTRGSCRTARRSSSRASSGRASASPSWAAPRSRAIRP